MVYEKSAAIQGYTNSIRPWTGRLPQMDARITELKEEVKTNDELDHRPKARDQPTRDRPPKG